MHKKNRHLPRNNPAIFQKAVITDNAVPSFSDESEITGDQIRLIRSSAIKLNKETEHILDIIADSLRTKLEHVVNDGESSDMKRIKIEVYMPIMCSPFCIENEGEDKQIIHINAPIQFSPVQISNIDDEPVE